MEYTKGKWIVQNISSHGLEIMAEVNMGTDANGGVLQPIYHVDIKPYIRIDSNGKVYAMIAYESWRQFPSINFQAMQKANAHLIAAAPDMYEALEYIVNDLASVVSHQREYFEEARKALAKARGK